MELKRTTEHHITENIEKSLKAIAQQGLNSKPFWNIEKQTERNNSDDLIAIKDNKGSRLVSEGEIKLHTVNYYEKLYRKRDSPNYNQQQTKFINNEVKKHLTYDTSNQEEYNKDITLHEVKRATKAIKNHKHKGPDEVRNELLNYVGEVLTQTLQTFFKMIFDSEDIPHQWKMSILINIDKGKKTMKNWKIKEEYHYVTSAKYLRK